MLKGEVLGLSAGLSCDHLRHSWVSCCVILLGLSISLAQAAQFLSHFLFHWFPRFFALAVMATCSCSWRRSQSSSFPRRALVSASLRKSMIASLLGVLLCGACGFAWACAWTCACACAWAFASPAWVSLVKLFALNCSLRRWSRVLVLQAVHDGSLQLQCSFGVLREHISLELLRTLLTYTTFLLGIGQLFSYRCDESSYDLLH